MAKVQESDVQVYGVGFLNPIPDKGLFGRWSKSVPEKAHDALQRIADETGGKAFFPQDISEIGNIVSEIAHELRNQYSIGYISSNSARDGTWRRLKIELDRKTPPTCTSASNAGITRRRTLQHLCAFYLQSCVSPPLSSVVDADTPLILGQGSRSTGAGCPGPKSTLQPLLCSQ